MMVFVLPWGRVGVMPSYGKDGGMDPGSLLLVLIHANHPGAAAWWHLLGSWELCKSPKRGL